MKIKNKGFTLIELMVTVAIVGILGAIAVPAYQDYTIRSQVTEGLSLASGAKVAVAEYYQNHGRYPADMATIGMTSSQGNFIQETNLGDNGRINAVFGNDSSKVIHNGTISLVPVENGNGNLEWNCESSIDEKYLPTSCVPNEEIEPEVPEPEEPYIVSQRERRTDFDEPGCPSGIYTYFYLVSEWSDGTETEEELGNGCYEPENTTPQEPEITEIEYLRSGNSQCPESTPSTFVWFSVDITPPSNETECAIFVPEPAIYFFNYTPTGNVR